MEQLQQTPSRRRILRLLRTISNFERSYSFLLVLLIVVQIVTLFAVILAGVWALRLNCGHVCRLPLRNVIVWLNFFSSNWNIIAMFIPFFRKLYPKTVGRISLGVYLKVRIHSIGSLSINKCKLYSLNNLIIIKIAQEYVGQRRPGSVYHYTSTDICHLWYLY